MGVISILKDNEQQLPIETIQDTMSDDINYESSSGSEEELVYEPTTYLENEYTYSEHALGLLNSVMEE